jgi:hypothetical protein
LAYKRDVRCRRAQQRGISELAAQGGLQGGGHNHFNKETTLRTLSRLAVAAVVALGVLGLAVGAYAAVSGTATPNSGLHNHDLVHIHATGLPALTGINVLECKSGATSSADCEGQTINTDGQTNGAGVLDVDYNVWTLPDPALSGTSITCDDTHPCVLYVGTDQQDFSGAPKTLIPISFAPAASTTTTTIGTPVPEVAKAILLPVSALGILGGGFVVAARRRRRLAGAAK